MQGEIKRESRYDFLIISGFIQICSILIYLNANIIKVGSIGGVGLSILGAFFLLSIAIIANLWISNKLYIRFHFLIFLIFVIWVSIRSSIDLGSLYHFKQITISTTGGILLFYLLGAFVGVTYHNLLKIRSNLQLLELILFIFLFLMSWMLYNFSSRLDSKLFYLVGVEVSYQREGDFLSISYIIISYVYIESIIKRVGMTVDFMPSLFYLLLYTTITFMTLVASQLFGSNAATAVVLGVYLITLVISLIVAKRSIWENYLRYQLSLPWSKRFTRQLVLMSALGLLSVAVSLAVIITITGFDTSSLRLLGFGSGTNTSLLSRIDILIETGVVQLAYAPFFGDFNVAFLTTGNAGRTLHSFFPFVMANLGLLGLFIVMILFTNVLIQIYGEIKNGVVRDLSSYSLNINALYSFFLFLYIVFFANLATGVSWPVLWFTLGLVSKPVTFKSF